jgi:hypothetical protein
MQAAITPGAILRLASKTVIETMLPGTEQSCLITRFIES